MTKMTKKDYELIADSLKTTLENAQGIHDATYETIVSGLAYTLEAQDKRFKRDKFLADCGVQDKHQNDMQVAASLDSHNSGTRANGSLR